MNWMINRDRSHCILVMIIRFINLIRLELFFWTETHINVSFSNSLSIGVLYQLEGEKQSDLYYSTNSDVLSVNQVYL